MRPDWSSVLSRHLLDRRAGHRQKVLRAFASACAAERLPPAKRFGVQHEKLASLLAYAQAHVPHWTAQQPVRSPEEAAAVLSQWPVMRRGEIQAAGTGFISRFVSQASEDHTGGSTGTPMQFRVDQATQVAREASLMWADSLAGWRPGEKIAMLWGSDRDLKNARKSWRLHVRWWIENRRWFNAFDMGAEELARYHQAMARFKPAILVAYAGAAYALAEYLEQHGTAPSYPQLGVVCSAEMLLPHMREKIEKVFQKPVFDRYGNREVGAIAAECEAHQGLHLNEHDMLVEIDSPDPCHVPGPILITYFHNRAMPFIRYDTGDLGLLMPDEPCACGRTTRRLARIVGRQSDVIRTRGGKQVHGEFFTHLLYGVPGVREFQFVQESMDQYRLRLVGIPHESSPRLAQVAKEIEQAVECPGGVAVDWVEQIPLTASGKRRFTLSLLPAEEHSA